MFDACTVISQGTELKPRLLINMELFQFEIKQDPHIVRIHWVTDCVIQWFIILGRIDYDYTFYRLECIATPNLWNGLEIAFETRNDWHYFYPEHFDNSLPSPIPLPPKIQDDSTNATNRKFQKLFRSTLIKCDRINFVVLNTFLTVFFFFLKLAKQIKFQFYSCRMLHLNPSFHRSHSGVNFLMGCLWNSPAIKWAWFFLLAQIALWHA